MAKKLQIITELHETTAKKVTSSAGAWKTFLQSANTHYKYTYEDQLLIYAQKPTATACASIIQWNNVFHRYVNRGTEGIALIVKNGNEVQKLKYVFDVADTNSKNNLPIPQWQLKENHKTNIVKDLEKAFCKTENEDFEERLIEISKFCVTNMYGEYLQDVHNNVNDSFLEELDSANVDVMFRKLLENTTAYLVMERCGIKANDYFADSDFRSIVNFNTVDVSAILGRAAGDAAKTILREISKSINKTETAERSEENGEQRTGNQTYLHESWGLLPARPSTTRTENNRDLGTTEEQIPREKPPRDVLGNDNQREVERTSSRDRQSGRGEDGHSNRADDGSARGDRTAEDGRPNEVGWHDEQHKGFSEGNNNERANLQLTGENIKENSDGDLLSEFSFAKGLKRLEEIPTKATEEIAKTNVKKDGINYKITDDELGSGALFEKYTANIEAIKLLKKLETDGRNATATEQEILSRYVGFGGLSDYFNSNKNGNAELKELLNEAQYESAKESTLTAFYTQPVVIKAMYQALQNMGFSGGNVLEPSCGTGNFFGAMPQKLMNNSNLYGVELDSITGSIAKELYQKANITVNGFEKTDFHNNFFDVAIGNVPFGQFTVNDKKYSKNNFLIHDYFFAKALDKVRPGGIVAFVTSKGTMDKANPTVRKYIAERADLLGAIRLPNNAFKANAGTEVTSDIIFLQKRDRAAVTEASWVYLANDSNGIEMNSYFVKNPHMVLGKMKMVSGRFGMESACIDSGTSSLEAKLSEAILHIDTVNMEAKNSLKVEDEITIAADPNVRNFSYTVLKGEVYFRENSKMTLQIEPKGTSSTIPRVKAIIGVRDSLRRLIDLQSNDYLDSDIDDEQKKLNNLYDEFTKKYGLISSAVNKKAFGTDCSYPLLQSLEYVDDKGLLIKKADIFYKRTIKKHVEITSADTVISALNISIGEKACVDMPFMMQLTKKSKEEIEQELTGIIFKNPLKSSTENCYETADEYLSGNVREKLKVAKLASNGYSIYKQNVAALEKVQPQTIEASDIFVKLGTTWIPQNYYNDFIYELLDTPFYLKRDIKTHFSTYTSEWDVTGKSADRSNVKANNAFGTSRVNAYKIIEESLNLRDVRIYDTMRTSDGKEERKINNNETIIAQQKQELIKSCFTDWIWEDPTRRKDLVEIYNNRFNSNRPREYNGDHLIFSGINSEIVLRPHQLNAIARILYGGNTLLAHVVGAGKTFEMIAAGMESKRLGLSQKSLYVVPNHLIEQWSSDFLHLYPAANILVADKEDFTPANRKRFCGRIATGEFDAVIIGHSQFGKIPISTERQVSYIRDELENISAGIHELGKNNGNNFSVKKMELARKKLKIKLQNLQNVDNKDSVIDFEQLGIDKLFIDEAHYFKNLYFSTKMRNVAGISQAESQKATDLHMKCQYLDEITDGKGVVFATGTPISNSMVELYTLQKYLQADYLKSHKLFNFDAFASTFGETQVATEITPDGSGYRAKTRFAKFFNLPELMNSFKEVADIQTADMINLPVPKANYHNIAVKPSEYQLNIVAELVKRAEKIQAGGVDPTVDNMLLITNDGRKLALDERLINDMLPRNDNSKASECAKNVHMIWEKTSEKHSTQLVFCDLSTPHFDGKFNVYDDLKSTLVAKGIPKKEIEFIHNANTEKKKMVLFDKVRNGKVRVLIGSTSKMGAGTNIQDKLIAIHHLDCPWRPSDLEQRNGRGIRQNNQNKEIEIYNYVTENTFDAYLYQLVENKQRFIAQIMTSKSPCRSAEDVDETVLSFAEIKALATGNPLIKEKMNLDMDVTKLKTLKAGYLNQKYRLEDDIINRYPKAIAERKEFIAKFKEDIEVVMKNPSESGKKCAAMTLMGKCYTDKEEAGTALLEVIKNGKNCLNTIIGSYRGFSMELTFDSQQFAVHLKNNLSHKAYLGSNVLGNITRLDNTLGEITENLKSNILTLESLELQCKNVENEMQKPFIFEKEFTEKQARLNELNILLNLEQRKEVVNTETVQNEEDEYDLEICD